MDADEQHEQNEEYLIMIENICVQTHGVIRVRKTQTVLQVKMIIHKVWGVPEDDRLFL